MVRGRTTCSRAVCSCIASLRQYVLVSHRERVVDVWTRGDHDEWNVESVREGEAAHLAAIEAQIGVRELYDSAQDPADGTQPPTRFT